MLVSLHLLRRSAVPVDAPTVLPVMGPDYDSSALVDEPNYGWVQAALMVETHSKPSVDAIVSAYTAAGWDKVTVAVLA